jgi:hypothetical protein
MLPPRQRVVSKRANTVAAGMIGVAITPTRRERIVAEDCEIPCSGSLPTS